MQRSPCFLILALILLSAPLSASGDEELYNRLSENSRTSLLSPFSAAVLEATARFDFQAATNTRQLQFPGNLRRLVFKESENDSGKELYLIRSMKGQIFVLQVPDTASDPASPYAGLEQSLQYRVNLTIASGQTTVDGIVVPVARLEAKPERGLIDRLFFAFIALMLILVMVGMGLTLRIKDFYMILIKPRAMLVGPLCQFGLLPFLASMLGSMAGYDKTYPYMYIGLILVSSCPGGVTSNLMTYWARGDLALSVSMTAFSTVSSLFFTPFLLSMYATNVPQITIPAGEIVKSILALVILPLAIGMFVRHRWEAFAKKSEKFFSGLGVFALIFLIISGILNNLEVFGDTSRYGLKFYGIIFSLTLSSMIFSIGVSKLFFVENIQIRAIALETGLQNAALAMTLAILLQDRVGDFHSSMFAVSGLYGLWMYVAGFIIIATFPKFLPVHFDVKVRSAGS